MPFYIIILIILFVLVAGVAAYFGYRAQQKRREALAQFAMLSGLSFDADDPFNLPGRLGHIDAFSRGHSREASNVLHGVYGTREVVAFDYEYVTGSGKDRHTYHFSSCVHPLECRFPALMIRPEGFFDKVADFFGFEDIDFESDEFSRKFRVKSANRKFAYDVCHPQMMEWLLANRGWQLELVGGYFVLMTDERWEPEKFRSALDFTVKFFEMIPEFVWREYRQGAKP
jgi:hypothetical protein